MPSTLKTAALLPFFVALLLFGCATQPLQTTYDAATDARIRVFSLPHSTFLYPGATCYSRDDPNLIRAHTGGKNFGMFNAFATLASNRKIGMPESGKMPFTYHEYVIPAGKPLTIESSLRTTTSARVNSGVSTRSQTGCGPLGVTFMPEAGKDYETGLVFNWNEGICWIAVVELVPASEGKMDRKAVDIDKAHHCP